MSLVIQCREHQVEEGNMFWNNLDVVALWDQFFCPRVTLSVLVGIHDI